MSILAYNRKINAPIRFLYYLEVFDLFLLLVFGVLLPLFVSSFLPVTIPLWHSIRWFMGWFFVIVSIKVGKAPGFVQHWISKTFKPTIYQPGKKEIEHFLIADDPVAPVEGPDVFTAQELAEIQASVRQLRQSRREAEMMQDTHTPPTNQWFSN